MEQSSLRSSTSSLRQSSDSVSLEVSFDPFLYGNTLDGFWKKLFCNPLFSDLTIVIGSEKINGHKVIISSWGAKWKEALSDGKNELILVTKEQNLHLYKLMLQYMYTGACQVHGHDVLPLLILSHEYGVHPLKEQCGIALFGTKDVTFMLDIVQKYSCKELEAKCAQYLAKEFHELMKFDTLLGLPVTTWRELLKSDEIQVLSEFELYKIVLRVADQHKDKRVAVLNELLPFIRFPFMQAKYLVEEVEKMEKIVPVLHELLFEAYRFKANPQTRSAIAPWRSASRRTPWRWESDTISSGLQLDETQTKVTHKGSTSTWQSVIGCNFFNGGVHSWDIKVENNLSNWLFIGVANKSWRGYLDQSSGYAGQGVDSWSYGSNPGWGKTYGHTNTAYGTPYQTGDVITISLDFNDGTLSFAKNGENYGVAFTGINEEVAPVATLYHAGDSVSISWNKSK